MRVHRGQILGAAAWPGIVTSEQRDLTLALLDDRTGPARLIGGPRRYMLTGLLVCGRCSTELKPVPLYPRRNADRQPFGCLPTAAGGCGGSLVVYQPAGTLVDTLVLARLRQDYDPADTTADLRRQVADLERQQEQLGRDLADDPSAALMVRGLNRQLQGRIDLLRTQMSQVQRERRVADPEAVADAWPTYDTEQKRAVIDVLVDRIVVGPHGGGPRFDPDRLTVVWR